MCNLDPSTIELLSRDHSRSLKRLEVSSYSSGFDIPSGASANLRLHQFVINSVPFTSPIDIWIAYAIRNSHEFLKELTIGYEELARAAYARGHFSNHTSINGVQRHSSAYLAASLLAFCF